VQAAGAAGAAAVIVVGPKDTSVRQQWSPNGDRFPVPSFVMADDDGAGLLSAIRKGGAVLDLTGTMASPYHYDVMQVAKGRIPEHVVHEVTTANTARVDTGYTESGGLGWAKEQRFGWRPWQEYSLAAQMEFYRIVRTPLRRAEYVSAGDTQWQHVVQHMFTWSDGAVSGGLTEQPRSYTAGQTLSEQWFGPVVRPAVPEGMVPTRTADTLMIDVPEFVDMYGHYGYARTSDEVDTTSARFYRDGQLVEERQNAGGTFAAVPGTAEYRLELSTRRSSEEWTHATATETAWTFRSARPAEAREPLPLLQVDYDVPADLNGQVPHGLPVKLGFAVRSPAAGLTVKDFTAELSYDDGTTWTRLSVLPTGEGRYTARVAHPAGKQVTVRVTATDTKGDQVRQTVTRAYGVK
jgi:hypothetical protein